jgi:hypothetical protein
MQNLIRKTLLLTLSKKILATSLLLSSVAFADDIGGIEEHKGSGGITRQGESIITELGLGVQQMDHVQTVDGRLLMKFLDDSVVRLTEHTEVTLTEYYYDPNKKADSRMAMNFVSGTARFSTGRLGLVPKEHIKIETPTASIGIRGTDFTTSVDELGRSLVILLPETECTIDGDCSPSGEITVTNEGGVVTLTEAYEATMVSSISTIPTKPVVLNNINLNMIDNMFIVSPPDEIKEGEDQRTNGAGNVDNNILDFTDLDTDYLADDYLAEDDLEFNELDMDLLDVDFLQDVLVALEEVSIFNRKSASAGEAGDIVGTVAPGFDKDTQYNTIIDQGAGQIWFYREVNGIVSIRIPIGSNVTLDTENEGKKNNIIVGDGQSVIITIRQGG